MAWLLVFASLSLVKIVHHVMWRDEWRAWQICCASPSLSAMQELVSHEGHPQLWYIGLYALSRFSTLR